MTESERGVTDDGSVRTRVARWVLLDADRTALAVGIALGVVALTLGLIEAGLITVDANSLAGSAFGSGAVAGLFTLITVVLSINQLILSRIFGSPDSLSETYQGTTEFRDSVAEVTGRPSIPNDPSRFLGVVGAGIREQATEIDGNYDGVLAEEIDAYRSAVRSYGEEVVRVEREKESIGVLTDLLGAEYAEHIAATERLRRERRDDLDDGDAAALDALEDLFEALTIGRQYFKTLIIQQLLAKVSRQVAVAGFVALLTAFYVGFVYQSDAPATLPAWALPWIASVGLAVVVSPLVILLVHILRIATIMWYTVSVGPFVRPQR